MTIYSSTEKACNGTVVISCFSHDLLNITGKLDPINTNQPCEMIKVTKNETQYHVLQYFHSQQTNQQPE